MHAAFGSHRDVTGNFEIPWDSTGSIPLESQWNSQLGFHWNPVGSQWDAWDLSKIPVTFSRWLSSGIPSWDYAEITCGICRDPTWDSRQFLPVESQLIPAGISLESHLGSQLNFLWGYVCIISWQNCIKSDVKEIMFEICNKGPKWQDVSVYIEFYPQGGVSPCPGLYTCIKSWKKCIKSDFKGTDFFLNL